MTEIVNELGFTCPYCHEPVDPRKSSVLQFITGWERRGHTRSSGIRGGSDILLRKTQDKFAHYHCIVLARAGVAAYQISLDV